IKDEGSLILGSSGYFYAGLGFLGFLVIGEQKHDLNHRIYVTQKNGLHRAKRAFSATCHMSTTLDDLLSTLVSALYDRGVLPVAKKRKHKGRVSA
ncbi:hypothetical protein L9F63_022223, partial [Diploptera punctata]